MGRILAFLICCVPAIAFALPSQKWAQADPAMHDWIMTLHAKESGYWCCDLADGELTQQDIRKGADGDVHWFVYVDEEWREVPDEALMVGPNKLGRPIVWVSHYGPAQVHINCFLPGVLM